MLHVGLLSACQMGHSRSGTAKLRWGSPAASVRVILQSLCWSACHNHHLCRSINLYHVYGILRHLCAYTGTTAFLSSALCARRSVPLRSVAFPLAFSSSFVRSLHTGRFRHCCDSRPPLSVITSACVLIVSVQSTTNSSLIIKL